jgi:hypothetical protein
VVTTWSGRGPAPAWLAGVKDRAKFLITGAAESATESKPSVAKKASAPVRRVAAKKAATKTAVARKAAAKRAATKKAVMQGSEESDREERGPSLPTSAIYEVGFRFARHVGVIDMIMHNLIDTIAL